MNKIDKIDIFEKNHLKADFKYFKPDLQYFNGHRKIKNQSVWFEINGFYMCYKLV